ncbi:MAG: hypothetical protein OQL16_03835 [Gammaproteobacteria bacterium]|nr:hypothetical protein [Gammaproteobacteria bacterium]
MAEANCNNCRFFRVVTKAPPIKGECHFDPPTSSSVFQKGEQISSRVAVWPLVRDIDFCSRFEEGKAPKAHKPVGKAIPDAELDIV